MKKIELTEQELEILLKMAFLDGARFARQEQGSPSEGYAERRDKAYDATIADARKTVQNFMESHG